MASKFWTYRYFNSSQKFTKRYIVYLYKWWWADGQDYNRTDYFRDNDYAEFDTIEEVNAYIYLIKSIYGSVRQPEFDGDYYLHRETGKKKKSLMYNDNHNDYKYVHKYIICDEKEQFYWGYALFDYKEEKIVEVYGDMHPEFSANYKKDLKLKDALFRRPGEIPANYKWDDGEYEGWLQFRFGNGLNAIEVEDRINREKEEKKKTHKSNKVNDIKSEFPELDNYVDEYDKYEDYV